MKKIILLLTVLAFAFVVQAQTRLTFTPATNDSIVGAATKYCTLANPITQRWNGVIEVYITPSLSGSDSTHIWVEFSQNGSTWYRANVLGTPMISGTATVYGSNAVTVAAGYDYKVKMGTTAVGVLWSPTWFINAPYVRVAVQHFVAAKSVKITRAVIYLKK